MVRANSRALWFRELPDGREEGYNKWSKIMFPISADLSRERYAGERAFLLVSNNFQSLIPNKSLATSTKSDNELLSNATSHRRHPRAEETEVINETDYSVH